MLQGLEVGEGVQGQEGEMAQEEVRQEEEQVRQEEDHEEVQIDLPRVLVSRRPGPCLLNNCASRVPVCDLCTTPGLCSWTKAC